MNNPADVPDATSAPPSIASQPANRDPQLWQVAGGAIAFLGQPRIMGIVNVTPDSFSDGGRWLDPKSAVDHGLQLVADGADILDIGGESTRPFSEPVSAAEERQRVLPVIEGLRKQTKAWLSIDTSKASVAAAAIDVGVDIVNDVTATTGDLAMLPLLANSNVGICAMHIQGTPATMQLDPRYQDVVDDIAEYLEAIQHRLLQAGIAGERICLDPGIGFGKTHEHNWELVRRVGEFRRLGRPLLVGHSRKGFIGKLAGEDLESRDLGTLAISWYLASQGVNVIRVHEVARTVKSLRIWRQLHPPGQPS